MTANVEQLVIPEGLGSNVSLNVPFQYRKLTQRKSGFGFYANRYTCVVTCGCKYKILMWFLFKYKNSNAKCK